MSISRRDFLRDGVAAFTLTFAAPRVVGGSARAHGERARNLVVLHLSGGNDALSTLVPYGDPFYYSRRPSQAVPAGLVLQVGCDAAGHPLGLHPRLAGLREIFNQGRLAIVQRAGYENSSRSHFEGTDVWNTAAPGQPQAAGWLARCLDSLQAPADPLAGWHASDAPDPLDRAGAAGSYAGTVRYPCNGFAQALRTVAGSIVRGTGTRTFRVQTGGYDTHARQGTNDGTYADLMGALDGGLFAFYSDLQNHGLLDDTLVLQFSEFGRRISENASGGTDHGAAGVMLAIGGAVRGGLYGTAPSLNPGPDNPTVENNGADVRYETDFRSVYARVLDSWLGADSAAVLGGSFRTGAPPIV
jgi:uncharacterized protein (DUF1501 family)